MNASRIVSFLALFAVACSTETSAVDSSSAATSATGQESVGECASHFGDELTPGFGRLDGTLVAIVRPVIDAHCAMPNRDHVVLQVSMRGEVYRLVVNVESDRDGADPRVRLGKVDAPLPAPAWEEGWHTDASLDYARTLGVHAGEDFTPMAMSPLVSEIVSELRIGDRVSVYAHNGSGRPESAHKVHRNRANTATDGAIVAGAATGSPRFLLFHFDGQVF